MFTPPQSKSNTAQIIIDPSNQEKNEETGEEEKEIKLIVQNALANNDYSNNKIEELQNKLIENDPEIIKGKKAQQKKGWLATIGGVFSNRVTNAKNHTIAYFLNQQIDKAPYINASKESILQQTQDPLFISLIGTLNKFVFSKVDDKLDSGNDDVLKNHKQIIKDILEINVLQGFATLIENVHTNRGEIVNYDDQPSFVNVFTYISQSAGLHVNQEILAEITESYREDRLKIKTLLNQLFPNPKIRSEKEKLINEYVHAPKDRKAILQKLLTGIIISKDDEETLLLSLEACIAHDEQLYRVFETVADAILANFFPDKVQSLFFPGTANLIHYIPWLPNYLYDHYIKSLIINSLLDVYKPIEYDANRHNHDIGALSNRLENNLDTIINIPASMLHGLTINKIHTDPNIVGLIAKFLSSLSSPADLNQNNEAKQKKQLIGELGQEQLASWLLCSLQRLLQTEDPNLIGLGQFANKFINDLSLHLLARGTEAVFPEGEKILENEFLKELVERITNKLKGNEDQAGLQINEQFLEDFLEELPLPTGIKTLIIPFLVQEINHFQSQFAFANLNEQDAEETIKSYKRGENILSLIEKFSDEMVEEILEKNIDFFDEGKLDDILDELLDIYLPGIKIEDNLKRWLKKNITSLNSSKDGAPLRSVQILKKGVQALLKQAIVNTITKNFKDDKDYAAQLLHNLDHAFSIAFSKFDENSKSLIIEGQKIQAIIFNLRVEIEKLNNQTFDPIENLTEQQNASLAKLQLAQKRYLRVIKNKHDLNNKQVNVLEKLGPSWSNVNTRYLARNVLAIYPIDPVALKIPANHLAFEDRLAEIKVIHPNHYEMINLLLTLDSSELTLLAEALNIDAIVENLPNQEALDQKLKNFEEACNDENLALENPQDWTRAKNQVQLSLEKQKAIENLNAQIETLEKELDKCLPVFKVLSVELAKLVGLDEKEQLYLPLFLKDQIWPYIQLAKEETISRLLFMHFTPLILVIQDITENREKIREMTQDKFAIQITEAISKQSINQLSEFVTSYKPFAAQILRMMGIENPDPQEISEMESALQNVMIELGNEELEPLIFEPLLEGYFKDEQKRKDFSIQLEKLTSFFAFTKFKEAEISELLVKFLDQAKIEDKKIVKTSQVLTKQLNYFLLAKGKQNLNPGLIIQTYAKKFNIELTSLQMEEKKSLLENAHITQKIKNVIITPEEIAEHLNDFIPGANDLHTLIAPELQAILAGEDNTFVEHRELLGKYIEGMLLRIFIKIAGANQVERKEVLEVIIEKLKNMIPKGKQEGDLQEISKQIIDRFIQEIGGLKDQADFKGVPLPLQNLVYTKLKEVLYQHLILILIPMLEVESSRDALDEISGSQRFSGIGSSLITYLINIIPSLADPKKVFDLIKENVLPLADNDLQNVFIQTVQHFIHDKPALLNNTTDVARIYADAILFKLFINISKKNPAQGDKDSLLVTIENILKIVEETYQLSRNQPFNDVAKKCEERILKDVLGLDSPEALEGLPTIFQEKVYSLIKNRLSDKLLSVHQSFQNLDSTHPEIIQARAHLKTFGADKQDKAYAEIFVNDLGRFAVASILDFLPELKEDKFINQILQGAGQSLEMLAATGNDLSDLLLDFVQEPRLKEVLKSSTTKLVDNNHLRTDKLKAATFISNLIVKPLNQVLEKATTFEKNLGDKAVDFDRKLVRNILGVVVEHIKIKNRAIIIATGNNRKHVSYADYVTAAGNKLPAGMPLTAVDYNKSIKIINKRLGLDEMIPNLVERNSFKEKLKVNLQNIIDQNENTPSTLNTENVIKVISDCYLKTTGKGLAQEQISALKMKNIKGFSIATLIRKESTKLARKLEKEIYEPDSKIILSAIFPNGESDLTFLPVKDREIPWKMFESIMPSLIPQLIETLFSPDMINKIVLSSLEAGRDEMRAKIILPPEGSGKPANLPLDDLDEVSGELITELMKNVKLPALIMNQIVGPKGISPEMKKVLGSALREQFNGEFIEKLVPTVLEALVKKDEKTGDFVLNPHIKSKKVKLTQLSGQRREMNAELKRVSRELINSTISNVIRKKWALFQRAFDKLVQSIFGNIGSHLKWALDKVLHFIFLTVSRKILSIVLRPILFLSKQLIYRISSLDKNLNNVLDIFRDIFDDQPLVNSYGINNIPLFHALLQSAHQTFSSNK